MDDKNKAALLEWGPRKVLSSLVNVDPEGSDSERQARDFVDRYGALYPSATPEFDVKYYAQRFRLAWEVKNDPAKFAAVNSFLDDIFLPEFLSNNPSDQRPVIAADFSSGKWKPRARTLLDVLALELMSRRKMLSRCERPECNRYFVKPFSRAHYCSTLGFRGPDGRDCGEVMREKTQQQWAEDHKDEINSRRRKPKSKSKRTK